MHELAIARAIVDAAQRRAGGRRVAEVTIRVGRLRQVVPASLDFYFGVAAEGTLCAGARLQQEAVAARLRCPGCRREWELEEPVFRCPGCGQAADVAAGEELEVESIEVEED